MKSLLSLQFCYYKGHDSQRVLQNSVGHLLLNLTWHLLRKMAEDGILSEKMTFSLKDTYFLTAVITYLEEPI